MSASLTTMVERPPGQSFMSRHKVAKLIQTLAPSLQTVAVDLSATETVVISTPVCVFGYVFDSAFITDNHHLADGSVNKIAGPPTAGRVRRFYGPNYLSFETNVTFRIAGSQAHFASRCTIFYTDFQQ